MNIFLVWFSIFSFSVFLISTLPDLLRTLRKPLRHHLIYLGAKSAYVFWLIVFTFLLFTDVFLAPLTAETRLYFGYVRIIISMAIVYFLPWFFISLKHKKLRLQSHILLALPAFIYGIPTTVLSPSLNPVGAAVISGTFFVYLTFFPFYVLISSRPWIYADLKNEYRPFVVYTAVFYPLFFFVTLGQFFNEYLLQAGVLTLSTASATAAVLSVIPRALFCLLWGVLDLVKTIRKEYKKEVTQTTGIPADFLTHFEITTREAEIIKLMAKGYENQKIGKQLFISVRTVESHIYRIYRKCNVKNKVELLNLVRSF